MKDRLRKAMENWEKVKLIFDYPNSKSAKVRRGHIKKVREDSFDILEDIDGLVTYSYKYLVEIKEEKGK